MWNRTYKEEIDSEFRYVLPVEDGFLLVGNTFLSSGVESGWIVRIDDQGNALWNLTVHDKETKLFSAAAAQDGFILVGLTCSYTKNDSDALAIKIDSDGRILWSKTYGWSGDDALRAVIVTQDDGIVVAGYTNSLGNKDYDFWLMKMSQDGVVTWTRTYGGVEADVAYSLAPANGGYVVAGETHSFGDGDAKAFVVKTDLNGRLLWQKAYGGQQYDTAVNVIPSSGVGYVVVGFTFSFGAGQRDFWMFDIDDSGNVVWNRTQGGKNFDEAYSIVEVASNQYVVAGWTNSFGKGKYDYYLVKFEATISNNPSTERVLFFYGLAVLAVAMAVSNGLWMFRVSKTRRAIVTKNPS
jgi:hypothetical protein